jgi:hypothetical protein
MCAPENRVDSLILFIDLLLCVPFCAKSLQRHEGQIEILINFGFPLRSLRLCDEMNSYAEH